MDQRLIQSPQMIQAMKILQLSTLDLQERIEQELVENPLLEVKEPEAEAREETHDEGHEEFGAEIGAEPGPEREQLQNLLEHFERIERDFGDGSRAPLGDPEEADRKLLAMQNTPSRPRTRAEAIAEDLGFLDLDPRQRRVAEFLVASLDERGYLTDDLETLARQYSGDWSPEEDEEDEQGEEQEEGAAAQESAGAAQESAGAATEPEGAATERGAARASAPPAHGEAGAPEVAAAPHPGSNGRAPAVEAEQGEADEDAPERVGVDELAAVLAQLRHYIHPGLGGRDLSEVLLLQLEAAGADTPLLRSIVTHHLEDLRQNRLPRIAKETGHALEAVKDAIETIRHLDPTPCSDYGESRAAVIAPDVVVEELDGEYVVRLDRQRVPELQLSPQYRELLRQARKGDGVEEWLKKRLSSARWFIDAVLQRQSTLERIANVIFARQRPFLDKGLHALQPLRMQEVADEVGVHISTVSRAVSGKYAQTPRGIYPLKFFFTGGTAKGSGEVASQVSVQQRIKELVDAEDEKHPLSDEELAQRLHQRDGIRIARRTVTKYRKMLDIPSSTQRRRF